MPDEIWRPVVGFEGLYEVSSLGNVRSIDRQCLGRDGRSEGFDVMHLDGDRTNNRVENLRYGARAENLHQTYDYGGTSGRGKLTKTEAIEVIRRLEQGEHPIPLAKEFGLNSAAMYHIKNGTTFAWLREEALNGT